MHFRLVSLSTLSVPTSCLKDRQMGLDTKYPELILTTRVVCWNKLSGYWQLKDKKNSRVTINDYLLQHSGVTIIYIYIYINCCFLLYLKNRKLRWSGWWNLSQLFGERGFYRRGFSSWRYFFSYSLVLGMDIKSLPSSNPKKSIFIEDSPGNEHSRLANQSQVISYSATTF